MDHPAPWTASEGYDQCDPGYYIYDARGVILLADPEGVLTRETRDLIVELRNREHYTQHRANDEILDNLITAYYRDRAR